MAGYQKQITSSSGTPNFYIDRTGPGGAFSTGTPWFSNEYEIQYGAPGCIGGLSQVLNCVGVSVVETQGVGGLAYALTSAFDQGCFFATLDQNGSIIQQVAFEFPVNSSLPTKPIIIPSLAQNTGLQNFFICGTYFNNSRRYTYILRVNQTPTVVWSRIYDLGTGTSINARAMVESLWSNDLAVVGSAFRPATAAGSKGFFMQVNINTGLVTNFEMVGQRASSVQNDTLSSISIAASTQGGSDGFIVGGFQDTIPFGGAPLVGKAWFIKLKPTGVPIWSSIFRTNLDLSAGMVMGVIERQNTGGSFQYYGAVFSPGIGIVVMRLNSTGNAYLNTTPILDNFNTYVYNGSSVLSAPNSISFKNAAGPDQGIHIYGTYDVNSGGDHYFVEAYFNGEEACLPTRNNLGIVTPGSYVCFFPQVSVNNGLTSCFNFNIVLNVLTTIPNPICVSGGMLSGSNFRPALVTSVPEQSIASVIIEVFPNPCSESAMIKYNIKDEEPVSFALYDLLGNLLEQINPIQQSIGNQQIELNFKNLGLEAGIYVLRANINGSDVKQKIIYRKE